MIAKPDLPGDRGFHAAEPDLSHGCSGDLLACEAEGDEMVSRDRREHVEVNATVRSRNQAQGLAASIANPAFTDKPGNSRMSTPPVAAPLVSVGGTWSQSSPHATMFTVAYKST
jgi:hypothetical protein